MRRPDYRELSLQLLTNPLLPIMTESYRSALAEPHPSLDEIEVLLCTPPNLMGRAILFGCGFTLKNLSDQDDLSRRGEVKYSPDHMRAELGAHDFRTDWPRLTLRHYAYRSRQSTEVCFPFVTDDVQMAVPLDGGMISMARLALVGTDWA